MGQDQELDAGVVLTDFARHVGHARRDVPELGPREPFEAHPRELPGLHAAERRRGGELRDHTKWPRGDDRGDAIPLLEHRAEAHGADLADAAHAGRGADAPTVDVVTNRVDVRPEGGEVRVEPGRFTRELCDPRAPVVTVRLELVLDPLDLRFERRDLRPLLFVGHPRARRFHLGYGAVRAQPVESRGFFMDLPGRGLPPHLFHAEPGGLIDRRVALRATAVVEGQLLGAASVSRVAASCGAIPSARAVASASWSRCDSESSTTSTSPS